METPEVNNNDTSIKNDKIATDQVTAYKVICYCCEKDFEEKDIIKIEARKDEFRFVCKRCNHLPEYQKTPMEIIKDGEENESKKS